ncbi:uncharacterized protein LOC111542539 [Piliocolobus tephrosceles]|uniref:uncharacterized protein LOC111542539 n=1 Tax=Piliocolobus tephrosceles TaxID=591936 RepID=UPI000C2A8D86|nr:uncharacterized protein LOC111542539 [Piliocolobus tephrosceles]
MPVASSASRQPRPLGRPLAKPPTPLNDPIGLRRRLRQRERPRRAVIGRGRWPRGAGRWDPARSSARLLCPAPLPPRGSCPDGGRRRLVFPEGSASVSTSRPGTWERGNSNPGGRARARTHRGDPLAGKRTRALAVEDGRSSRKGEPGLRLLELPNKGRRRRRHDGQWARKPESKEERYKNPSLPSPRALPNHQSLGGDKVNPRLESGLVSMAWFSARASGALGNLPQLVPSRGFRAGERRALGARGVGAQRAVSPAAFEDGDSGFAAPWLRESPRSPPPPAPRKTLRVHTRLHQSQGSHFSQNKTQ